MPRGVVYSAVVMLIAVFASPTVLAAEGAPMMLRIDAIAHMDRAASDSAAVEMRNDALSLGEIIRDDPAAAGTVAAVLRDNPETVMRLTSALVLLGAGGKASLEALAIAVFDDDDLTVRRTIVRGLPALGDAYALERILREDRSVDARLRERLHSSKARDGVLGVIKRLVGVSSGGQALVKMYHLPKGGPALAVETAAALILLGDESDKALLRTLAQSLEATQNLENIFLSFEIVLLFEEFDAGTVKKAGMIGGSRAFSTRSPALAGENLPMVLRLERIAHMGRAEGNTAAIKMRNDALSLGEAIRDNPAAIGTVAAVLRKNQVVAMRLTAAHVLLSAGGRASLKALAAAASGDDNLSVSRPIVRGLPALGDTYTLKHTLREDRSADAKLRSRLRSSPARDDVLDVIRRLADVRSGGQGLVRMCHLPHGGPAFAAETAVALALLGDKSDLALLRALAPSIKGTSLALEIAVLLEEFDTEKARPSVGAVKEIEPAGWSPLLHLADPDQSRRRKARAQAAELLPDGEALRALLFSWPGLPHDEIVETERILKGVHVDEELHRKAHDILHRTVSSKVEELSTVLVMLRAPSHEDLIPLLLRAVIENMVVTGEPLPPGLNDTVSLLLKHEDHEVRRLAAWLGRVAGFSVTTE